MLNLQHQSKHFYWKLLQVVFYWFVTVCWDVSPYGVLAIFVLVFCERKSSLGKGIGVSPQILGLPAMVWGWYGDIFYIQFTFPWVSPIQNPLKKKLKQNKNKNQQKTKQNNNHHHHHHHRTTTTIIISGFLIFFYDFFHFQRRSHLNLPLTVYFTYHEAVASLVVLRKRSPIREIFLIPKPADRRLEYRALGGINKTQKRINFAKYLSLLSSLSMFWND